MYVVYVTGCPGGKRVGGEFYYEFADPRVSPAALALSCVFVWPEWTLKMHSTTIAVNIVFNTIRRQEGHPAIKEVAWKPPCMKKRVGGAWLGENVQPVRCMESGRWWMSLVLLSARCLRFLQLHISPVCSVFAEKTGTNISISIWHSPRNPVFSLADDTLWNSVNAFSTSNGLTAIF